MVPALLSVLLTLVLLFAALGSLRQALAVLLAGKERVLPLLERGKLWLFAQGDVLVGLVSVALAVYLGWEGIQGLQAPALLVA